MDSYLRKVVPEDLELLFDWANDPDCRKNAFHTESISLKMHQQWFWKKIKSEDTHMFIFMVDNQEVGQVRIDLEGNEGEIDYFIQKNKRGKGFAIQMLREAEKQIKKDKRIATLIAQVKKDNFPSNRVFEKLEYQKEVKGDIIIYRKRIGGGMSE